MEEKLKNRHALAVSKEYPQANFTWIISLVVALIFLGNSFSFKTGELNTIVFAIFIAYLITTLLQLFITWKMKRDLLNNSEIRRGTRRLGYIQLLSLMTGNIFTAAFAFNLINKRKTPEYTFAVYMFLTQLFVIAISAVNIFKPYVTDTFPIAMLVLLVVAVFHLVVIILVTRSVTDVSAPRWMATIAVIVILTAATGNLFALLLGWSLLLKSMSKDHSRIMKWNVMWEKITRNSTATLGMFFIILMFSISVVSEFTFDYSLAVENDYGNILQTPNLAYPFGTDNFGRDVFTRIIFGA